MATCKNYDHIPKILHHDEHGFVAHCSNCNGFQVGFGNICIRQTDFDFRAFASLVSRYYHRYQNRRAYHQKDIYLDSPYPGFSLLFSEADLERLNHILQKTLLILEARENVRLQ